jgi:hypothetical protein
VALAGPGGARGAGGARGLAGRWSAPSFPDSPSIRVEVWKGEVIASTEEELLTGIQG